MPSKCKEFTDHAALRKGYSPTHMSFAGKKGTLEVARRGLARIHQIPSKRYRDLSMAPMHHASELHGNEMSCSKKQELSKSKHCKHWGQSLAAKSVGHETRSVVQHALLFPLPGHE